MEFGKNLRKIRESHQMSRQLLAEALNLSYSSICKYERGIRTPDFDSLVKISILFDITLEQLVGVEKSEYAHIYKNRTEYLLPNKPGGSKPYETASDLLHLSDDEEELIKQYRFLSEKHKKTIQDILESFSDLDEFKIKNSKQ